MATNKRKDAAALFELLDNSTLKVPKNAGSLKIPSWWSSKTNPTQIEIPDDVPDAAYEQAGNVAVAPVATAVASPQSRLFEPSASGEMPAAMPSIRPPAALVAPMHPAVIGTTPAAKTITLPSRPASSVVSPPKPPIDPSVPVAPREPKIFAPQMYAQQRRPWVTPRPGAFARLPAWVLGSGVAAVLVIVVGVVLVANRKHNTAVAAPPGDSTGAVAGAAILPTPERTVPGASGLAVSGPAVPVAASGNTSRPPIGTAPTVGPPVIKAYGPGEVNRQYEQYYVIVASTPSKDVAEKNAQFIAKKGVGVSIEVDKKGLFHLVSVEGFPSTSAAQMLRARIVEIGHQTEAYKRTHRAWDDAMVQNHLSTPK